MTGDYDLFEGNQGENGSRGKRFEVPYFSVLVLLQAMMGGETGKT
jgi:hypothetical protein